jgi:hypothetical protein
MTTTAIECEGHYMPMHVPDDGTDLSVLRCSGCRSHLVIFAPTRHAEVEADSVEEAVRLALEEVRSR